MNKSLPPGGLIEVLNKGNHPVPQPRVELLQLATRVMVVVLEAAAALVAPS